MAYKVTKNASDERRQAPACSTTPRSTRASGSPTEVERRLFKYVLDHKQTTRDDQAAARPSSELWFVPVVNVDGYDYTFTAKGTRLWRKNLRDNDGDGVITTTPTASTPTATCPRSGTTTSRARPTTRPTRPTTAPARPPSPRSRRCAALEKRIQPQVPDRLPLVRPADPLSRGLAGRDARRPTRRSMTALAGDDDHPAVAGLRPGRLGGALHDQRRRHRRRATTRFGIAGLHRRARRRHRRRRRRHRRRARLVHARAASSSRTPRPTSRPSSRRTSPFALDLARSAKDPEQPGSHLRQHGAGLRADDVPDLLRRPADRRGQRQARRSGTVDVHWQVNGGARARGPTTEYEGGDALRRAGRLLPPAARRTITGTQPGDKVKVWFTGGPRPQLGPVHLRGQERHAATRCCSWWPRTTRAAARCTAGARTPGRCTWTTTRGAAGRGHRLRRLRRRRDGPHGADARSACSRTTRPSIW